MDASSYSWPGIYLFNNCFHLESTPELPGEHALIEKPPPLYEREIFESSISASVETPTYETRIDAEVFELQRPLNQTAMEIKSAAFQILSKRYVQPDSRPKGWVFISQPPSINVQPITPSNDYRAQLNSPNWIFVNSDETDDTTDASPFVSALELSQEDVSINTPLHVTSFDYDDSSDTMLPSSKRGKLRESGPFELRVNAEKPTFEMETKVSEMQNSLTPNDASSTSDKKPNLWTCVYWNSDDNARPIALLSEEKHAQPNSQQHDWIFDPDPEDVKTSAQLKKRKRKSEEPKPVEEVLKLSQEDQRKLLKQRLLAKIAKAATNPSLG